MYLFTVYFTIVGVVAVAFAEDCYSKWQNCAQEAQLNVILMF